MANFVWTSDKSITLVGIMGAGKSKLGKLLSKELSMPFIDTDHEIIAASQSNISDLFQIYGQDEFRKLETRVLKRIFKNPRQIIATGEGGFLSPINRKIIKDNSVSIWLRAKPELVIKRTSRKENRPQLLLADDPEKVIKELIQEREEIYRQADIVVDSEAVKAKDMIEKLISSLKKFHIENLASGQESSN